MFRLSARYDVNLEDGVFLFNRPISDDLCYNVKIDDFDVVLCLNPDDPRKTDCYESSDVYWATSKVRVSSYRNENVDPPTPKLVNGHLSYEELWSYCEEREPAYRQAALEVMKRAIIFFKYRLHNPNLSILSQDSLDFQNPVWIVEGGKEFRPRFSITSRIWPPKKFGVEHLSSQDDQDLENALQCPIRPDLSEELISDAQSAIFHDDFRRAVLEMAIACETAVKQAFFAKATPAGAAYEYLEDKGKVEVTIVELISSVAKQAFGRSFKEDERSDYDNIDLLFRCRNKVAHRGELIYKDSKDNSAVVHSVDKDLLTIWWDSVAALLKWLHANTSTKI